VKLGVLNPANMTKPFTIYGKENIEQGALDQMSNVMSLDPVVAGALMPDAHQGYGMPIGGVCAVKNALIPYAVGVDIGCRMHLTVFNIPYDIIKDPMYAKVVDYRALVSSLHKGTYFGGNARPEMPHNHEVMDSPIWGELVKTLPEGEFIKDRAWRQLGTSGGGNHFVEWGEYKDGINQPFLALLSHSGSRSMGYNIANHYTALAAKLRPLAEPLNELAWFDSTQAEFHEYFAFMNLAGDYSAANHCLIHKQVTELLSGIKGNELLTVSNHHNFAWYEQFDGEFYYVHRKGATPAQAGVPGIIPGSMATPSYVVVGKGNKDSINSSSHGAGRAMSRSKALKSITPQMRAKVLSDAGVHLIQAGIDESPQAYKDIVAVMEAQKDLIDIKASFTPRVVRMGGKSEVDRNEGA
jgi:tRNA-splicing ligase RtcB